MTPGFAAPDRLDFEALGFALVRDGEERRGIVFRHQIPLTGTMEGRIEPALGPPGKSGRAVQIGFMSEGGTGAPVPDLSIEVDENPRSTPSREGLTTGDDARR